MFLPLWAALAVAATSPESVAGSDDFAAYVGVPDVDPFPHAPDGKGWGLWLSPTNVHVHLLILDVASHETAEIEMARRLTPEPALPAQTRLIFEAEAEPDGANRRLTSAVVQQKPLFIAKDVAACEVVQAGRLILTADADPKSVAQARLKLQVKAPVAERLRALAKKGPESERVYLTFGNESPAWTYLAAIGRPVIEVDLPAPFVERFKKLCTKR